MLQDRLRLSCRIPNPQMQIGVAPSLQNGMSGLFPLTPAMERCADQACLLRLLLNGIHRDMNRTIGNRRIARKVAIVATALGLWGALVLLFAAPLAVRDPGSWRQAVSFGASFWALWLLLLPAVAWLSFRFPIERRRLLRNVGLHLLFCLLIVGTSRVTFQAFVGIFPRSERSEAPGRLPDSRFDRPELQHQRL